MNRTHVAVTSAAALLGLAGLLLAGPLTPPSGPVTPTYKTLAEVEPRTAINATNTPGNSIAMYIITQPGSYYLTGNISSVPSGKHGIMVLASGVTIDLNGYMISGVAGSNCGVSSNGVYYYNVTVKNGTIQGFSGSAVDFSTIWAGHVQNIALNSNVVGIKTFESLVEGCTAMANGTSYVGTNGTATFYHCTSSNSTGNGFTCQGYSVLDSCTSSGSGSQGFSIGDYSTIRNCVAIGSGAQGIVCGGSCNVTNNQSRESSGFAGIWATGSDNVIDGNDSVENGWGLYVQGTVNLIIRNRCALNNTNYYIVTGNRVGLIYNSVTNSSPISGSSGGGLGSTDPYANLIN